MTGHARRARLVHFRAPQNTQRPAAFSALHAAGEVCDFVKRFGLSSIAEALPQVDASLYAAARRHLYLETPAPTWEWLPAELQLDSAGSGVYIGPLVVFP